MYGGGSMDGLLPFVFKGLMVVQEERVVVVVVAHSMCLEIRSINWARKGALREIDNNNNKH